MNANLTSRNFLRAAGLALFSTTLLVGCGADDALDPEQFPEPIASEQISTLSEPLTTAEVDALRAAILTEINKARAVARVCGTQSFPAAPALKRNGKPDTTAQAHSVDMATKNYFSHTGLDGRDPFKRMTDAGYKFRAAAENIAAGNSTAAATVQQWIKSSGHCANLMSKSYVDTGIGYGYSATSTYKHYWTQNFGAPL